MFKDALQQHRFQERRENKGGKEAMREKTKQVSSLEQNSFHMDAALSEFSSSRCLTLIQEARANCQPGRAGPRGLRPICHGGPSPPGWSSPDDSVKSSVLTISWCLTLVRCPCRRLQVSLDWDGIITQLDDVRRSATNTRCL